MNIIKKELHTNKKKTKKGIIVVTRAKSEVRSGDYD